MTAPKTIDLMEALKASLAKGDDHPQMTHVATLINAEGRARRYPVPVVREIQDEYVLDGQRWRVILVERVEIHEPRRAAS